MYTKLKFFIRLMTSLTVYKFNLLKIGKESDKMKITDIKIRKLFDDGPMKAIASVTFDAQLAVHDIKVINARDKFFIVMPSRKNADETYRDIVHPINAEFRAMLEKELIAAYNEALIEAENAEIATTEEVAEEQPV